MTSEKRPIPSAPTRSTQKALNATPTVRISKVQPLRMSALTRYRFARSIVFSFGKCPATAFYAEPMGTMIKIGVEIGGQMWYIKW